MLTLASVAFIPGSLLAGLVGVTVQVDLFDHPNVVAAVLALVSGTVAIARRGGRV